MCDIYFMQIYHNLFFRNSNNFIWQNIFFAQDELYKAPDVSTVPRDSFEKICQTLAEGTPFVGTYLAGKRRSCLPYCKIYKSPRLATIKAKKAQEIGHAVVIIGAGMKKGKKYFYFLNSWGKKFCPRKNKKGETVKGGIGKLRAEDLTKNLVKLCPPDQIGKLYNLMIDLFIICYICHVFIYAPTSYVCVCQSI